MEAHLRPVPTPDAEERELADTLRDFEEFYGSTFRRLFTALCLVTGNRHEAEEIMQDAWRGFGRTGPCPGVLTDER